MGHLQRAYTSDDLGFKSLLDGEGTGSVGILVSTVMEPCAWSSSSRDSSLAIGAARIEPLVLSPRWAGDVASLATNWCVGLTSNRAGPGDG